MDQDLFSSVFPPIDPREPVLHPSQKEAPTPGPHPLVQATEQLEVDIYSSFSTTFEGGYQPDAPQGPLFADGQNPLPEENPPRFLRPANDFPGTSADDPGSPDGEKGGNLRQFPRKSPPPSPYIKGPAEMPESRKDLIASYSKMMSGDDPDESYDDYFDDFDGDDRPGFFARLAERFTRKKKNRLAQDNADQDDPIEPARRKSTPEKPAYRYDEDEETGNIAGTPTPPSGRAPFPDLHISEASAQMPALLGSAQADEATWTKEDPLPDPFNADEKGDFSHKIPFDLQDKAGKTVETEAVAKAETFTTQSRTLVKESGDDYVDFAKRREVSSALGKVVSSLSVQVFLLFILALFSLYHSAARYFNIPVLAFLDPLREPFSFVLLSTILLALAIATCPKDLAGGLTQLVGLQPVAATPFALAVLAVVIQHLVLLTTPMALLTPGMHLYGPVAIFGLFFFKLSSWFDSVRIKLGFSAVSSGGEKYVLDLAPESPFLDQAIQLTGNPDTGVVLPIQADFLQRYLELSKIDGQGFPFGARLRYPFLVLGGLVIAIICLIVTRSLVIATSFFVSFLLVLAAYGAPFVQSLPLFRAARTLAPKGAFITNLDSLHDLAHASAMVCDASDFFPPGSVVLQGLKTFESGRIDEAILDACSVMEAMGGTLAELFLQIIEYRTDYLNPVESIRYEEGLGIVAWSGGRRILIGNRELLHQYNILAPSLDYEEKYRTGGRDLVYLASAGVLKAMYMIKYKGEVHLREKLQYLAQNDVVLLVHSLDSNLTSEKLADLFAFPREKVMILPERGVRMLDQINDPQPRLDATTGYNGNMQGALSAFAAAIRLSPVAAISKLLWLIGVVMGVIMVVSAALFAQMLAITPLLLILFSGSWWALICLLNVFRRLE